MNGLSLYLTAFGWAILHSLWQILLIALVVRILLKIYNASNASFKYNLGLIGLVSIPVVFSITLILLINNGANTLIDSLSTFAQEDLTSQNTGTSSILLQPGDSLKTSTIFNTFYAFMDQYAYTISILWILGFLFFSIRFSGSYLFIYRLKNRFSNNPGTQWQEITSRIAGSMGIRRPIRLLESAATSIPMVIGHFKPTIILPLGLLTHIPFNQLEAILVHEMAHIRRNDYFINLIRTALETIFFYHPGFWWLSSVLEEQRENSCDDATIDYCGSPEPLQKALLDISLHNQKSQHIAAALYKNENQLLKRIKRMKTKNQKKQKIRRGFQAPFFFLLAVIIIVAGSSFIPHPDSRIKGLLPLEDNIMVQKDPVEISSVVPTTNRQLAEVNNLPDSTSKSKQKAKGSSKSSGLINLQLDDAGNLVSVTKDGKELSGEERKKYEHLTQNIQNLQEKEESLLENEKKLQELHIQMNELALRMAEVEKEYVEVMHEHQSIRGLNDNPDFPAIWYEDDLWSAREMDESLFREQELAGLHNDASFFDEYNSQLHEMKIQEELFHQQLETKARVIDDILKNNELNEIQREEYLLQHAQEIEKLETIHQIEMEHVEFELKIRKELVKDEIIKEGAQLSFELSAKRLVVNGTKQSAKLQQKYLNIYNSQANAPLSGDVRVIIQD